jgi:hypothetical protein
MGVLMGQHVPRFALTPAEVRWLAMVLAECDGQGFDERDFWLTEDAHRDFLWIRDRIFAFNHELQAEDDANHAHSPP